ncbi:MAG TPA: sugar ABC transporter ATP-binding protein, partial [Anaerolineae bacterium]
MDQGQPLLRVEGIAKSFPGVQALADVSLQADAGEILALVGENGAGKSTLIHILAGVYQPDAGQVYLNGVPVSFANTHEAEAAGVSVVFQELSLVSNLTVAENVFAGRQPQGMLGLIDQRAMYRATQDLLELFQVDFKPATPVSRLSMGNQQMVEIIKALARNAKVLVLDEPTSSLTLQEANRLFDILRRLKAQGLAILYVSHHLEEIFAIADRVAVLRDGRLVGVRPAAELNEHQVVSMMVGRDLEPLEDTVTATGGREMLKVEGFTRRGAFEDVSFTLHQGEVLTFFGLVGAGRTEVARALMALDSGALGRVWVDGRPVQIRQPSGAMAAGMAYLSEDRKNEGLFLEKTISENFLAPNLSQVAPRGWLRWDILQRLATSYTRQLDVRAPSLSQKLRNLSGGNQQKVFLGEWLATGPQILIVDEPTRGIDVGTKQEIHRLLRGLARAGKAVMVISSDLPEALRVSDRIAVMREGRLVGFVDAREATEEKVMALAAGVSAAV